MRRARITMKLHGRLQDAAARYKIPIAEIMRRASVAFLRAKAEHGVVNLPKRETTTRNDSMSLQALGLDEDIPVMHFSRIANWYLDKYDHGGSIDLPEMTVQVKPMAKALKDIRRKVSKVKP